MNTAAQNSIPAQFHRNFVAIVSLVVAIASLGYNSWRNEVTEENRNVRDAGFYLLQELGELQLVVDHGHYGRDEERGDPITGWGHVTLVRDMAMVMPSKVQGRAEELFRIWDENWTGIGEDVEKVEHISAAIQATRDAVRDELAKLE